MKKLFTKAVPALVLALIILCTAGCGNPQKAEQGTLTSNGEATEPSSGTDTADPTVPTVPNAVEGVEDWSTSGTQLPTSQSGNQTGDQQTGNQTGNQTGDQQTGNQTGNQTGDQSGNEQTGTQQPTPSGTLTIEEYEALSTSQQQAYFMSFSTVDAFYEWLEAAEAARKPGNTVTGDGTLDLGDIVGKQN